MQNWCGDVGQQTQVSGGFLQTAQTWANAGVVLLYN